MYCMRRVSSNELLKIMNDEGFYDSLIVPNRDGYFVPKHPKEMSRHDKTNKMTVRPAKTQISLGIVILLVLSCRGSNVAGIARYALVT